EIVDLDVLAAVVAFPRPELGVGLALEDVAATDERLAQAELVVVGGVGEVGVGCGFRRFRLDHALRLEPGLVAVLVRVQPVVDEDRLAVGLGLVAQPVLRARARGLERDLLAADAVQAVAGAEVAVELEGLHRRLEPLDLRLRLPQEVVGRLRRQLALVLLADVDQLAQDRLLRGFLGDPLRGRGRNRLGLLDLLLERRDPALELLGGLFVLLLELLELLLEVLRRLGPLGQGGAGQKRHDPGSRAAHRRPSSSRAVATIRSGSNPNFSWSALSGAEAPKAPMPMTRPVLPT